MYTKRNLVIALILFLPLIASAQESPGGVTIVSNPPGAEVVLNGSLIVAGVTPVSFMQGLEGRYQIRVKKYGFETYKSSVYLQAGKSMSLTIKLKPKTKFKALARSLFVPGWGQMYSEQRFKGGCLFILAAGATASCLVANADYDDKSNRYDDLLKQYNQLSSFEEMERFYTKLASARKEAYDAESTRRIAIGAMIAAWGLNLLDIIFYFPGGSSLVGGSLSIEPDIKQGGAQIVLSHRF